MPNKIRHFALFTAVIGVALCASGCAGSPDAKKYSETQRLMGTFVKIDVCRGQVHIEEVSGIYEMVWMRMQEISWRMDAGRQGSDVYKINTANRSAIEVAPDTFDVIKKSIRLSKSTKGAFDITVRPLINLWRESEQRNLFPKKTQVGYAQKAVGSRNIGLYANNNIAPLIPQLKIDLGGIAKGYAVDEAARILRAQGIMRFFIDAGGDIYVGGLNCDGKPWRIGIRNPQKKDDIIDIVHVTDMAVVTSGDYEQYFEIEGERFSHIINPLSGYPQKDVISATVIAPNAMDADAVATALCVLGRIHGTEYVEASGGKYASLIIEQTGDGLMVQSESQDFKKFRKQ